MKHYSGILVAVVGRFRSANRSVLYYLTNIVASFKDTSLFMILLFDGVFAGQRLLVLFVSPVFGEHCYLITLIIKPII